jgi:hypothetical protein
MNIPKLRHGDRMKERVPQIHDVVDYVNSEGNYHEFIFRIVEV